jgi:hypothetical protein
MKRAALSIKDTSIPSVYNDPNNKVNFKNNFYIYTDDLSCHIPNNLENL